jgi:DNA polymerase III subunit delta
VASAIYLLLGPENGQKSDFIADLKKRITAAAKEAPEEHRYYPFKAEYRDLVAVLRNTSLFSRHRLVILNQAHEVKTRADVDILTEYCSRPADDATFVMVSDLYQIDRRIAATVPKDNKKVFWELFENQKRAWISSFFQKASLSIDTDAVELILELVENDTQDLKQECERLALFLADAQRITVDNVEELTYHSKSESVFTLFDRMAQGDFPASLEILQSIKLSGEGDPAKIFGGLVWQIRRLLGMRRLIDKGHGAEDALRKLNIRGKKNQRTYSQGCSNFDTPSLERILSLVASYESAIRTGKSDLHDTYLQKFIFDAVVKKGAGDRSPAFS